jgi:hypothetical protein
LILKSQISNLLVLSDFVVVKIAALIPKGFEKVARDWSEAEIPGTVREMSAS